MKRKVNLIISDAFYDDKAVPQKKITYELTTDSSQQLVDYLEKIVLFDYKNRIEAGKKP